ncbi:MULTISPECIES: hypothetical protein [unclassified Actinotalea]|uniref:hypothetical protein n=1 Tax=unclassified Actinotalea TaxID=2638618 RepID=UPI0015F74562|nr:MULTISPECIES: hypothetical protein [unclassified Actinotalea]
MATGDEMSMTQGRPLGGPPGADEIRRRRVLRVLMWLLAFGVTGALAVAAAQGPAASAVAGGFAVVLAVVVTATTTVDRRRRREELARTFAGSLLAARAGLDQDALRTVRDTEGELAATRAVMRRLPMLSLEQAVDIVRSL